jgi:carboxypeptidase family protein
MSDILTALEQKGGTMRVQVFVLTLFCLVGTSRWTSAQTSPASIAGTVRDSTGAVLPGVTVEASSPALIEKVKAALTDGSGQYRIVDLRPGVYTVTFTLTGFGAVKREGLELPAGFTATVNADLRVGAVTETLTVTGASPVVDVQNSQRTEVLNREVVEAIPTSREFQALALLIPGVIASRASDTNVGGASGQVWGTLAIHGGQTNDMKYFLDGYDMQSGSARGTSNFQFMDGNYEEYVIDVAAQTAEASLGGVRIGVVPKSGGNTFRGTFFGDFTNKGLSSNNVDDNLRQNRGLTDPNVIKSAWRAHPTFGGPIRRDRLWFYATASRMINDLYVAGNYYNLTPNTVRYTPDLSRQGIDDFWNNDVTGRLTWQATSRQKVNFYYEYQNNCHCHFLISPVNSPDGSQRMESPTNVIQGTYTVPFSNRLLFEAGVMLLPQHSSRLGQDGLTGPRITDIVRNISYNNANGTYRREPGSVQRASLAYVTGTHSIKVGMSNYWHQNSIDRVNAVYYNYTFVNGVPTGVTYLPGFATGDAHEPADLGVFAQDQWSVKRLTMNYGVRFDYLNIGYPDTPVAPSANIPTARVFPALQILGFKDLSPRFGVAYDLFGNAKTALKGSINRYVGVGFVTLPDAIINLGNDIRSWNDVNGNFIVDADQTNPAANGELGPRTNGNFAKAITPLRYDTDYSRGYGTRPLANWEMSAGIQHELMPRVSLNAAYFRRVFTTFEVTQNAAVSGADYDPYCVTAPRDPRLPGGGGQQVCGLYDLTPSAVGRTDRVVTSASNFGNQREHFNGVDLSVNARLARGALVQGGLSTGKIMGDDCQIVQGRPEVSTTAAFSGGNFVTLNSNAQSVGGVRGEASGPSVSTDFCHIDSPWLASIKALGSYTLPGDVRVAATWQSTPGRLLAAYVVYSSAQVAQSLGRPLSSASTVTVNVAKPGTLFTDRFNELDLRLSKILRFGRLRAEGMVDFFNVLNSNAVTEVNAVYGTTGAAWQQAQGILAARLVKFGVQFNF